MAEQAAPRDGSEHARIDDAAARGYRVLFELGRGGMGAAFLARAEGAHGFERLVVIKRIRPERLDARSIERFLREAKLAAAIHHANVVSAQSVGEDAEGPFIVLDYVDGASIEELLDRSLLRQQSMPVGIMLRVALDTLAGLQAVHEARDAHGVLLNVLHRDVSLQNILVGRDGVARLLDFGIARSNLGGATTDQRYVVGKLPYLPPEYLRREPLTPSADVYGLGVTLWLALAGRELWPEASEAQLLHHIVSEGVPRLSTVMQVAPDIVELVARATSPLRGERFASAREMAATIEQLGRERGWVSTHHEVAEWLEQLAGVDLERRRERVAISATGSAPRAAPTAISQDASEARPLPKAGPAPLAIIGMLVTLMLAALAAWGWSRTSSGPGPATSSATNDRSGLESAPKEPPPPSIASAPEPPEPVVAATPAAPSPSTPSKRRHEAPPGKAAASAPAPGGPVRPPDQISKKNPYRN